MIYLVVGFSSARASSYNHDDKTPVYSIDGKISKDTGKHFFHSISEDYPWLELAMPEGYVRGVFIFTRYAYGSRVTNIEVRAGMTIQGKIINQ